MARNVTLWVAMDIGCIECGEPSELLGIFETEKQAEAVCDEHSIRQRENWEGEHSFEVFKCTELNKINRVEY